MLKRTIKLKKKRKKRYIVSILALSVLILGGVFGTYAWLTFTQNKANHLQTAYKTHENFDPTGWDKGVTVKKQVWVKNNGNLPIYVRVKIIPFWKDGKPFVIKGKDGKPEDTATLNLKKPSNWVHVGDFYYYKKPLAKKGEDGDTTDDLLESVTLSKDLPSDYNKDNFEIDVITESIQINPGYPKTSNPLKELWGIDKLPQSN